GLQLHRTNFVRLDEAAYESILRDTKRLVTAALLPGDSRSLLWDEKDHHLERRSATGNAGGAGGGGNISGSGGPGPGSGGAGEGGGLLERMIARIEVLEQRVGALEGGEPGPPAPARPTAHSRTPSSASLTVTIDDDNRRSIHVKGMIDMQSGKNFDCQWLNG